MTNLFLANLLFLATILYFAFRGYRQGFFNALLSLLALLLGYAAAIFLYRPLGQMILDSGLLKGELLAYAIGGMIAFFFVQMIFAIPGLLLYKRARRRKVEGDASRAYWISGATIGIFRGFIYAVLVVWLIMFYRASKINVDSVVPDPSVSERVTGKVVASVSQLVMKEQPAEQNGAAAPEVPANPDNQPSPLDSFPKLSMAPAITHFVAQPERGVKNLKVIVENPNLKGLLADEDFQKLMIKSSVTDIQNDPAFSYYMSNLLSDQDFRQAVTDMGWEEQLRDEQMFRRQWAEVFFRVQGRLERLRQDPEAVAILLKPEIQSAVQSQDIWTLMNNADFNRLLKILSVKP